MRTLHGRGDWRPAIRIEGLLRYAFIGDSHAYGAGVAVDQTLSANTERQLNEFVPGWPIEAVNFGVSGYNLWNSWLAFKRAPQVYNGVVFSLCNNDAELFGRTYQIVYKEPHIARWEVTHPFRNAVTHCFDDIAEFSQKNALPVAIVFFNLYPVKSQMQITEIIANLCTTRGICFVETLPPLNDRNLTHSDRVVSVADFHPSALALEILGRHLAMTLRREGWLEKFNNAPIGSSPDRILAAAKAMVEADHYPPDIALHWALRAFESKSRLARRKQATGEDGGFNEQAARILEQLTVSDRRWHLDNRLHSFLASTSAGGQGASWALFCSEEERLKLEELCFALKYGGWEAIAANSLDLRPELQPDSKIHTLEQPTFLDETLLQLEKMPGILDSFKQLAIPPDVGETHSEEKLLLSIASLTRLTQRLQEECISLKKTFEKIEHAFQDAHSKLSENNRVQAASLINAAFSRIKDPCKTIQAWPATLSWLRDADHAAYTTVEVTVSAGPVEGKPAYLLGGQAEYSAPYRLPFGYAGTFLADGESTIVKLYFPIFYAGRILLKINIAKHLNQPSPETSLIKVVVYNQNKQRRAIPIESFSKDSTGRFVSPMIYLT